MQREEKQQDAVLEAIINKVNDLKTSIGAMIFKVENEYETLNWPSFLDNFALISSQLTSLTKILSNEKAPPLRNFTVLPLLLKPDLDENLARLTDGRLNTFSHDIVPDYLRTKPEPDAELKMMTLEHKASCVNYDTAQKQVAAMNKVVGHVWDIVSKARDEWDGDASSRAGGAQTSSIADTNCLVAAISLGKGLKHTVPPPGMMGGPPTGPQRGPGALGPPQGPPGGIPNQMGQMGKTPSAIKTNIKAAGQIHPYNR
ncbi:mediator of RNA polymerase II transcription subunit 8 [Neocloeon triangulifer]|uniref:mediator of RNA polymerase II transcription subunit 8 n=1 Tax=Neocloeon triangulifer TaxID=2078957 RepID=UPI00286ECDFF|nr:mediator of RNA polymerase II transcription subunit 8 [Neocloeon triangulifer]